MCNAPHQSSHQIESPPLFFKVFFFRRIRRFIIQSRRQITIVEVFNESIECHFQSGCRRPFSKPAQFFFESSYHSLGVSVALWIVVGSKRPLDSQPPAQVCPLRHFIKSKAFPYALPIIKLFVFSVKFFANREPVFRILSRYIIKAAKSNRRKSFNRVKPNLKSLQNPEGDSL